ncbi:enoyl-CoA hydratase-related protein [Chloroflexota bacterium]
MEYKYILYEQGRVARIKFNRPDYRNALSYVMIEEVCAAFNRADADEEVQVIVLSGEGRHFSTGHDMGSPEALAEEKERGFEKDDMTKYLSYKEAVDSRLCLRGLTKPTIAMVHGWCIYEGFMMASTMDIIFVSEDAKILPPTNAPYFPLPYEVGARKAKEILFENRVMSPFEARDLGFVNRVYPRDKLEQETLAFADRIADNINVRACKMVINHIQDAMGFTSEVHYAFQSHYLRTPLARAIAEAEAAKRGEEKRRFVAQADVSLKYLKLKEEAELTSLPLIREGQPPASK